MFGTLVFGINTFATVAGEDVIKGLVWLDQCVDNSVWAAQGQSTDAWEVAAVANTSWEVQKENEILTKECT